MKRDQKTTKGKSQDLITAAWDAFDRQNYAEVVNQTQKALQDDVDNADVWSLKGDALFELGRYEEAISCFDNAAGLDSTLFDADVWTNKGNAVFALRQYEIANQCYDRALKLEDDYKWAWRNKGLVYHNLKNYEEAFRCYNKAVELDPEYADVWVDKGNLNVEMGLNNEALICYDKAIEIDPENLWVWGNKGWTLSQLGKYDEALVCYEKATELDPTKIAAWNEKGLVLNTLARYADALHCFEKANDLDPEFAYAWRNKGTSLENLGRMEEARKCYQKALDVSEKIITENLQDINIWIMRSVCYLNLGDVANAEKALYDALKIDPKNLDALLNLVSIYGDYTFDFEKSAEYMRRLLEINPTNSSYKLNYVETLLKNKCYKESRELAVQLLPEITADFQVCMLRFFILVSYIFEGTREEVEQEFRTFIDSYQDMAEPKVILEDRWTFRGLIMSIRSSNIPALSKFTALALVDLLQGKIKGEELSFPLM